MENVALAMLFVIGFHSQLVDGYRRFVLVPQQGADDTLEHILQFPVLERLSGRILRPLWFPHISEQ